GCGVAMGNAETELKSISKEVTDTNDNHGVYKFLIQKI
ncbi:MAG: HAD hydrolase family protein, partial [Cetobacterium sp.]